MLLNTRPNMRKSVFVLLSVRIRSACHASLAALSRPDSNCFWVKALQSSLRIFSYHNTDFVQTFSLTFTGIIYKTGCIYFVWAKKNALTVRSDDNKTPVANCMFPHGAVKIGSHYHFAVTWHTKTLCCGCILAQKLLIPSSWVVSMRCFQNDSN